MSTDQDLPAKQLSMVIAAAAVRQLPDVPLPPGYTLRTYRPGDEGNWLTLLHQAGFDSWTLERFVPYMREAERVQGSHCIQYDDQLVAATFASHRRPAPPEGRLDYVIAHPDHSGKKLGKTVCTAVLRYLVGRGYQHIFLLTDDSRLPALKVYLDLGFRPVINRRDMLARWETIYRQFAP